MVGEGEAMMAAAAAVEGAVSTRGAAALRDQPHWPPPPAIGSTIRSARRRPEEARVEGEGASWLWDVLGKVAYIKPW